MEKFSKLEALFNEIEASEQAEVRGGWSKKVNDTLAAWSQIANAFEGYYSARRP